MHQLFLLALSIAPGLIICLFVYFKDKYNREPLANLLMCIFLGVIIALPALYIELSGMHLLNAVLPKGFVHTVIMAFVVIALTEEYCKYAVLRLYAYPKRSFDEPLDGIVYSVFVAMGFATIENAGYVYIHGAATGWLRMFLSVPAHASFAVLMGYYVGLAKFATTKSFQLQLTGILLAILFHGSFDCFLFLSENKVVAGYVSAGLLVFGALVSYIFGIRLSLKAIRKHRLLSKEKHEEDLPIL